MSFGFFGIQFGWGLQMANMSAIYQYLGAEESDIAFLWLAAPLTGLLVQPVVGYFSDRTWSGLGRRRPYLLAGAVLSSLALIAMPNSSAVWMAAGVLWILDAIKHVLGNDPMNAVWLGGASMVLAGLCVSPVSKDVDGVDNSAA